MRKILIWLLLIAVLTVLYFWHPHFFDTAYQYISHGDISGLSLYLQSFGSWTILIILLLFIVMTFSIIFPFMILSGAAGIIYGIYWGVVISWAGEVVGAIIMFIFARWLFRDVVERMITKSPYLQKVDEYSGKNGFSTLLIARLLPLAPSGIITAVAAVSKISWRDFLFATLIGKLPPVIIKVIVGHDLAYASQHFVRLISLVAVIVAVYIGLWLHRRRKKKNGEIEEDADCTN